MSTTRTEAALLLLALLAPPLEALTQHTQQQRHLVFAPGSDWEFAYKYIEDACPNINPRSGRPGDVPDSMPIAWYSRGGLNQSSLISATSQGIHASTSVGATLDQLSRKDCGRVVFNSSFMLTPESYANHQWLQSVRLLANGSAYGLVHNEFKPELVGGPEYSAKYCPCVLNKSCAPNSGCELWSTGLAVSHDRGQTFALVRKPPEHTVFTLPSRYTDDQSLAGYGAIGTMLPGSDGYYYGMVNIAGQSELSGVASGNCPFRTNDLTDPGSFRGWGGTSYNVKFRDPYLPGGSQGAGLCHTVPTNSSSPFDAHVCIRRFTDGGAAGRSAGFVAVGPQSGGVRYSFCTQEGGEAFEECAGDYSRWTLAGILSMQSAARWQMGTNILYPVLLDHASPAMGTRVGSNSAASSLWAEDGDNFALTSVSSKSLWLYFVSGHNILRRRVQLSATPEPPSPPPPPPLPSDCQTIEVVGAGMESANGAFKRQAGHGALPVFYKDASHQVYPVTYTSSHGANATAWHLGHDGVAGSVLYARITAQGADGSMPPSFGWMLYPGFHSHTEVAPAPALLRCL